MVSCLQFVISGSAIPTVVSTVFFPQTQPVVLILTPLMHIEDEFVVIRTTGCWCVVYVEILALQIGQFVA